MKGCKGHHRSPSRHTQWGVSSHTPAVGLQLTMQLHHCVRSLSYAWWAHREHRIVRYFCCDFHQARNMYLQPIKVSTTLAMKTDHEPAVSSRLGRHRPCLTALFSARWGRRATQQTYNCPSTLRQFNNQVRRMKPKQQNWTIKIVWLASAEPCNGGTALPSQARLKQRAGRHEFTAAFCRSSVSSEPKGPMRQTQASSA